MFNMVHRSWHHKEQQRLCVWGHIQLATVLAGLHLHLREIPAAALHVCTSVQLIVRPGVHQAQSCAITLRSPASERSPDLNRYSPDIRLRARLRLHSAWPRLLACARLGHAPSRAAGSPARRPPAALAPRAVRASAARLLGRRGRAIQRRTRWSQGDSARLTPRLASLCGSLVLASPPGTRAARAAATAAQQESSDGRVVSHRQRFTCC